MQQGSADRRRVVWIVDDSPFESQVAREALSSEYEVHGFSDGSAALERLAAGSPPDVLVLDWVMPGLSGIEICQFLRSRPATAELPVLLLTVQQNTDEIVQGLGAGANDYLGKPYAAPELRARVGALVRSRAQREQIDRAQRVLRRVLAQLPDAVVTIDAERRILFVNSEAERILGSRAEALIDRALPDVLPALQLGSRAQAGSTRQASLPDVRCGDYVLAPRVSIPPSDDEGNTTFTLRDVTEVRRQEARRVDFYSMVAHDLRSPLSAILMRTQMLQQGHRGPVTPEVKAELERMHAGVRDLVRLITDFLDLSQIETGNFRIDRKPVDVRSVIAAAVEEYQPLADARNLRLTQETNGPAVVEGDARRLMQVVANLLSNAIKYTQKGGQVLVRIAEDPHTVEIDVADDGPGISQEALPRLFRKYERIEDSSAARAEGTGLGLVIVKEIVEAHGGTVGARSTPGSGSTFWLRLPRANASLAT
jgi:two-component system phosphate regulon sensor histidine kinase PhoR